MNIKGIYFKNFKSFGKETYFEIKPITLIYGKNGSGKSSIIQLLQFLKQSYDNRIESIISPVVNIPGTIDLGSFNDLIYKHDTKKNLEITFEGYFTQKWNDTSYLINQRRINNSSFLSKEQKKIAISKLTDRGIHQSKKFYLNLILGNNIIKEINLYYEDRRKKNLELKIINSKNNYITKFIKIDEDLIDKTFNFLNKKHDNANIKIKFNNFNLNFRSRGMIFISIYMYFLNNKKFIKNRSYLEITKETISKILNRNTRSDRNLIDNFKFAINEINREIYSASDGKLCGITLKKEKDKFILGWDKDLINRKLFMPKSITNKEALFEDLTNLISYYSKFSKRRIKEMFFGETSIENEKDLNFSAKTLTHSELFLAENINSFKIIQKILSKKKLNKIEIKKIYENLFNLSRWANDGFLIDYKEDDHWIAGERNQLPHLTFSSFIYNKMSDDENKSPRLIRFNNVNRYKGRVKLLFPELNIINDEIKIFLAEIIHLSPQSVKVPRFNTFKGTTPSSVGYSGENMPDLLFKVRSLVKDVNDYLSEIDVPYQIQIKQFKKISNNQTDLYEVRIFDKFINTYVHLSDTGYGISQLVTFLVQLIASDYHNIVMKEELEAHLHPTWQSKLPELIYKKVSMIMDGDDEFIFRCILETHSEHLVLKINKMIKEKIINPNDVAIYYAYKNKKTKSSHIDMIRINENGEFIDKWRDGFFMERLDLL